MTERKVVRHQFEKIYTSAEFPDIELWKISRAVGYQGDGGRFRQTSRTLSDSVFWKEEVEDLIELAAEYRRDRDNFEVSNNHDRVIN